MEPLQDKNNLISFYISDDKLKSRLTFFLNEDDAHQHDFLGVTDSESAETPISSPPQHHSDHEDSEFALFRSQMSAELMKNFVDNMPCLEGGPRKKPCSVSYSESENRARHTASISLEFSL